MNFVRGGIGLSYLNYIALISIFTFVFAGQNNIVNSSTIQSILDREINTKLSQTDETPEISSEGCYSNWINDGYCDLVNNRQECAFDGNDCIDEDQSCYYKSCDYWNNSGEFTCDELESDWGCDCSDDVCGECLETEKDCLGICFGEYELNDMTFTSPLNILLLTMLPE